MSSETFPIASNLSVSCSMAGNTQMTANQLQWFDEGTIILKAFNSEKVRQVIHYRPFPDDGYPRRCLLERNKAFLTGVLGLWGYESLDNLSIEQMVDKIFLHSITPFQPVLWHWSPTLVCSQDAQAIAEAIESESHYHFKTIPFAEIVRVSLGYETDAVKWFSHQHTLLSKTVTEHLRHHPEEVSLYEGVEKV
ncbi:uncharacterized protein N7496_006084 [Penicillium cataractarum]|uniref:Uncharacterized protein n=1 Tax=Penicillium cataractarum TaxID=2100454 RepID=A0A9W9S1J7_9EURO|nr:uncharacterized protein N7496_006084 [Penicillium cataractarum]KAJ5369992.1 hypothetical protein N7496_006084 [Penicillium cataractarum]